MAYIKSIKNGVTEIGMPDILHLDNDIEPFPHPIISPTISIYTSTRSPRNLIFQQGFESQWQHRQYNHWPKRLEFKEDHLPRSTPFVEEIRADSPKKTPLLTLNSPVLSRGRSIAEMSKLLKSPKQSNNPSQPASVQTCEEAMVCDQTEKVLEPVMNTGLVYEKSGIVNSQNQSFNTGSLAAHGQYSCRYSIVPYQRPPMSTVNNSDVSLNNRTHLAPVLFRMKSLLKMSTSTIRTGHVYGMEKTNSANIPSIQYPGCTRFQSFLNDNFYISDLGRLKDVKPYMICGWISKNYLSALRQKTNLVSKMLDVAVDQVGDIRPEVVKMSRKTTAAIFAKDLMFRVFTLEELNHTKKRISLSLTKMGAVKRCLKREFPDMTSRTWRQKCLPQIRGSIKILFRHRVKYVIDFWKKMDVKEQ